MGEHTLTKCERLHSRSDVEALFSGGSRSMAAFPLRLVYHIASRGVVDAPAEMLVSVPKKYFKRAVKRNRVKRQVREAFRKNKGIIAESLDVNMPDKKVMMAFIWLDDRLYSTSDVAEKVERLMTRLSEKISR